MVAQWPPSSYLAVTLEHFSLFKFRGPATGITSAQGIAVGASLQIINMPTFTLIFRATYTMD